MNDISFEGWKLLLWHTFIYPGWMYYVYWALPALLVLLLIAHRRSHLTGTTGIWTRLGRAWRNIGWIMCLVVVVMYACAVYSVPRFKFEPFGLKQCMLTSFQNRLVGVETAAEGNEEAVAAFCRKYTTLEGLDEPTYGALRIVRFFYNKGYSYLHSVLFAILYFAFLVPVFLVKGYRIERTRWMISSK